MAGRVITIASPLQLQLDGLAGGAEQTIVLRRAVPLAPATEATLRVGVAMVALESPATPGFVLEVRPVLLAPSPEADVLGDPVASISIEEVSPGTLLLAQLGGGVAGPVQVSIRCGQPLAGPLQLSAHVDLVVKWTAAGPRRRPARAETRAMLPWWAARRRPRRAGRSVNAAACGGEVACAATRVARDATAGSTETVDHAAGETQPRDALAAHAETRAAVLLRRIHELSRRLGPSRWLERALVRAWQTHAAAIDDARCACAGDGPGAEATRRDPQAPRMAEFFPTAIDRNLAAAPAVGGPGRDDPDSCGEGVCCTTTTFSIGPDVFGNSYDVVVQVCYPEVIVTGQRVGIFLLTHGSPDGVVLDTEAWLEPGGGGFLPLQHDLARDGILSFFIVRPAGYEDRANALMGAIGAAKLYIATRATQEPASPFAQIDLTDVEVALGGHSDGGAAAIIAAAASTGVPVRAVVGLASGQGVPMVDAALHPGTYYLGIVGTHDGSPSVKNDRPVQLYDAVETDRPKVLVVLRGVNHGQLGPGAGTAGLLPGSSMMQTAAALEVALVWRSYLVRRFLRWTLLRDDEAGRDLALDDVQTLAWGETQVGDSVPADFGPHQATRLARFPAAEGWLAAFRCHTIFSPGGVGSVEAVSASITSLVVGAIEDATTPSDANVIDCEGLEGPAWAPTTGHRGNVLLVDWDDALDPSGAVVRFALGDALSVVGGIQPSDHFSIVVEIALRVNAPANVPVHEATGAVDWYPAIALGDDSGAALWVCPQPVMYGFGYVCPQLLTGEPEIQDARRTVLTSISARLPLLIDDVQLLTATHVYVDLLWGAFQSGEAAIRNVGLVYHG